MSITPRELLKIVRDILGGGSDIDADNPLPVGPGTVFHTLLREALAGIRGSYINLYLLHPDIAKNLNDFFVNSTDLDPSPVDLATYWTTSGLTIPPGATWIGVSTAFALRYPQYQIRATWPVLGGAGSRWMGLENGGGVRYGMIGLLQNSSDQMNFATSGTGLGSYVRIDALLPSDWQTARHYYMLKANVWGAECYVDGELVGLQVFGRLANANKGLAIAGPPYGIIVSDWYPTPPTMPAMLEPSGAAGDLWPVRNSYFRYTEGDPCPPRRWPLYDAGTTDLFAGLAIASGDETSHPVPVFGYAGKTLLFRCDKAGTLVIETLTAAGNWRTYDTVTTAANTLEVYNDLAESELVLVRVKFTPDTYTATISDAEVICR